MTTTIDFENTSCMLCGSSESVPAGHTAWRGHKLNYAICAGCGLKFMSPRPTRDWYASFYATEFWEDKFANRSWRAGVSGSWLWKLVKGGLSGRLRKGGKRARLVVPEILNRVSLTPHSRVLDVGCSFGLILHEIRKTTGAMVYGVEPNESARQHAERSSGVKFVGRTAENLVALQGRAEMFDLIIFSNSLENIVHPKAVLTACRELLSEHGTLYIDTPNVYYYDAMNPYHPFIYSPVTLPALLSSCGLECYDVMHEAETTNAHDLQTRLSVQRPRFVTAFAKKGATQEPKPSKIDTQKLIQAIALSGERYANIHRSWK